MMRVVALAACALPLSIAGSASADEPDPGWAIVAGAVPSVAGFIVGSALVGASAGDDGKTAGWLTIQSSFVLAPLLAHAVAKEWGRGAVFAAIPAAALAGAVGLFEYAPSAVDHGTLEQQRVLWALLGVGLLASAAGVVDAVFAKERVPSVYVAPMVSAARGTPQAGLAIGGPL